MASFKAKGRCPLLHRLVTRINPEETWLWIHTSNFRFPKLDISCNKKHQRTWFHQDSPQNNNLKNRNTLFSNKKNSTKLSLGFSFPHWLSPIFRTRGFILGKNTHLPAGRGDFFFKLSLSASPRFRPWDAEVGCYPGPFHWSPFSVGFSVRDPGSL